MKKNLTISLIALLMSVVFCNANAQSKNPTYSKGYSPAIEIGYTHLSWTSGLPSTSTTHGYNFGNGLFLGGGTGISFNKWKMNGVDNRILIPVYADIKYSFMNKLASPFVELKAGGLLDCSAIGLGYMIRPSVGVDIWKFSLHVGVDIQKCAYAIPRYSGNDINDLKFDGLSQGIFGNAGPYFGVTFKF